MRTHPRFDLLSIVAGSCEPAMPLLQAVSRARWSVPSSTQSSWLTGSSQTMWVREVLPIVAAQTHTHVQHTTQACNEWQGNTQPKHQQPCHDHAPPYDTPPRHHSGGWRLRPQLQASAPESVPRGTVSCPTRAPLCCQFSPKLLTDQCVGGVLPFWLFVFDRWARFGWIERL